MDRKAGDLRRKLAVTNQTAYEQDVAATLTNLAALYTNTERPADAEKACTEALIPYRKLAANQSAYKPNLAKMLNNLAILYSNTQRPADSEKANLKALMLCRQLAAANPTIHEPDVAITLSNLGLLHLQADRRTLADSGPIPQHG